MNTKDENAQPNAADKEAVNGRMQQIVRSFISWVASKMGCYLVDYNIDFCDFEYWVGLMDKWQTAIADEDEEMAKYYEGRVQQCEKDEAIFLKNVIR